MSPFEKFRFRKFAGLIAVIAVVAPGCGDGDGLARQAVSGTVKFEGEPLAQGNIQFFPVGPSENAIATGGPITSGSYSIPTADGLVPGKYKVMISAAGDPPSKGKAEEVSDMPGLGPLNAPELIPAKYNARSELEATVEAGGSNEFEFDLTK